jgi:thioredoxin reductase (NADPH)
MEAIGRDLREMQRTPLAPSHVAALREVGAVVHYEAGEFLAREPIHRRAPRDGHSRSYPIHG